MKILSFVNEIDYLSSISHGWGCGYVVIPREHPSWGADYNSLDVDVHGGLTYGESVEDTKENFKNFPEDAPNDGWVFGFDCAHHGDNQISCPESYVLAETERLAKQFVALATNAQKRRETRGAK
jgi:hypothetical protein